MVVKLKAVCGLLDSIMYRFLVAHCFEVLCVTDSTDALVMFDPPWVFFGSDLIVKCLIMGCGQSVTMTTLLQ